MMKTFLNKFILLFLILMGPLSFAESDVLNSLTRKYQSFKLIEMNVEKTVKLELQGRESKYLGRIYLANGKFRWETTSPIESLLIYDGSVIWSVETPAKELGGVPQIARGKINKKTKSQILLSTLVSGDFKKSFKVVKETKEGGIGKIDLVPLGNELQIKLLKVEIDLKTNMLNELSYKDDLGNKTTLSFSKIKFSKKPDNMKFKYQPPKGAQVTDL